MSWAVRMTTGVGRAPESRSRCRMARVIANPSISGSSTSMSTQSKGCAAKRSRASLPVATMESVTGSCSRKSRSSSWLAGLSSTRSTRAGGAAGATAAVISFDSEVAGRAAVSASVEGREKKKREPTPGWLSTQIRPPICSTRRLEMASPSPAPSLVPDAVCVKGRKIRSS